MGVKSRTSALDQSRGGKRRKRKFFNSYHVDEYTNFNYRRHAYQKNRSWSPKNIFSLFSNSDRVPNRNTSVVLSYFFVPKRNETIVAERPLGRKNAIPNGYELIKNNGTVFQKKEKDCLWVCRMHISEYGFYFAFFE